MAVNRVLVVGTLLFWSRIGPAAAQGSLAQQMLTAHNLFRLRVGTPPLVWSRRLAARAQEWADTLIANGEFAPRRDGQSGENLFEISGGDAPAATVVKAWMSEEASYSYKTNSCSARCGHFTQVIWKSTRFVGCGVARGARREVWVCNYDPPGNIVGERPY